MQYTSVEIRERAEDALKQPDICDRGTCIAPNNHDLAQMILQLLRGSTTTSEQLAQFFHDTYEELAPNYGYRTRMSSAVPWSQVPEPNKSLMIAVAEKVLERLKLEE